MFKASLKNFFAGRSIAASQKVSFVNLPGDTSSADKVTFYRLFQPASIPVAKPGDYGVFLGGNGLYPASVQAQVVAHMAGKPPKNVTTGIAFQDVQPGLKKGG